MLRPRIVANWKMFKTPRQAKDYFDVFLPKLNQEKADVWFAVPFIDIPEVLSAVKGTSLKIGAQNLFSEKEGAFTGEISGEMLKEAGAAFTLVGHSERRRYFYETDELIQKKVKRALDDDLEVVLCIGETLEEREQGLTQDVLKRQIGASLAGIFDMQRITLAYEPVWAIGTGRAMDQKQAQEAHLFCRSCLEDLFQENGKKIPLLYGGSVNADNAKEFLSQKDIDGVLVGGVSLRPDEFIRLILSCKELS